MINGKRRGTEGRGGEGSGREVGREEERVLIGVTKYSRLLYLSIILGCIASEREERMLGEEGKGR